MYSPKIDEKLIPILYRVAKSKGIAMTTLVNDILQKALGQIKDVEKDTTLPIEKKD
jgi:hypothetical protein